MKAIFIDRNSAISLHVQIYERLRDLIFAGDLRAGEALPPSRELANELKVSRNVVLLAYEQLYAEGFVYGRSGSGTYVSEDACFEHWHQALPVKTQEPVWANGDEEELIDFKTGIPALDLFPRKEWARICKEVFEDTPAYIFGYGERQGQLKLRTAIANYLLRTRGIRCQAEQIQITNGSAQAFSLLAQQLLRDGAVAMLEDPTVCELHAMLTPFGGRIYPVPVDENGLKTECLPEQEKPRLVFVTPSHQFPLGGTLSIQRRIALVRYAEAKDCYIVEDDYDSEFRYDSAPVSSLQSLQPDRVIYIGSFSKILSPALRQGYMVLPEELIEPIKRAKGLHDLHTPSADQLVLAEFIERRLLDKHIKRLKKVYQHRRDCLIHCLESNFANEVLIKGTSTGLHLVAEFPAIRFTDDLLKKVTENGVKIYPVESFTYAKGQHESKILLGYGHLQPGKIEKGIACLKKAIFS